jgi:type VI secretion system protein ImpF
VNEGERTGSLLIRPRRCSHRTAPGDRPPLNSRRSHTSAMQRFTPSLFERLFDDHLPQGADHMVRGLSLEQVKASVARDLEALLNSRLGVPVDMPPGFPHARSSVLTYG